MDTDLTGRVALVTGAARGIGRATALALAGQGADLALLDLAAPLPGHAQTTGTRDQLDSTAADVRALGRRALPIAVDVRDAAAMQAAVTRTADELDGLDIVVANAGIAVHAPFEDHSDEAWDLVLDVNILGTVHTVRPALPALRRSRAPRVVLISSVGGRAGTPGVVGYSVSKWGLIGLGKTLALELGKDSFTVSTIAPTAVDTPLFRDDAQYRDMVPHLYQQEHSFDDREAAVKELLATSVHALPVPWVEPRDVADAVTYLVSDRARYVTGTVLDVAAGSNAHHMACLIRPVRRSLLLG